MYENIRNGILRVALRESCGEEYEDRHSVHQTRIKYDTNHSLQTIRIGRRREDAVACAPQLVYDQCYKWNELQPVRHSHNSTADRRTGHGGVERKSKSTDADDPVEQLGLLQERAVLRGRLDPDDDTARC